MKVVWEDSPYKNRSFRLEIFSHIWKDYGDCKSDYVEQIGETKWE